MRGYCELASVRTYLTGVFIPYPHTQSPDGSPISKLRRYNHKWPEEHDLAFGPETIVLNKMQIAMPDGLNCRSIDQRTCVAVFRTCHKVKRRAWSLLLQ